MKSLLACTSNTRAILTDSLKYIRSDVPDKISDSEIQWLLDNNITTVIDLRDENERKQKKCSLIDNNSFDYFCMPVTGGNTIPESPDSVPKSYVKMIDSNMNRIIETILHADTNVIYFCNAGKDRTGVVSAVLLYILGYDREYIINDYMQSAKNLREMLEDFSSQHPELKEIITPQRRYIKECISWLENNYDNFSRSAYTK